MTRLVVFLMVLEIFNNKSVNSTFKYKLGGLNTWQLVPDITDYKLEFMTQKFSTPRFSRSLNFGLVKLKNFYDNATSFFLTQFNLKLVIKIFQ